MIEQEIHKMQDVISEMGVWFVVSWSVLTSYLHNNKKKNPKEQHNHTLSVCLCGGKKVKKKKKVPELTAPEKGSRTLTLLKKILKLFRSWKYHRNQNYLVPGKKMAKLLHSWKSSRTIQFLKSVLKLFPFPEKKKNLQNSSVPEKQLQNSYIPEKGSGTLRFLKKVPDHFSSQNSFQNSSVRLKKKKFWKSSFLKTFPKLCSYWKKFLEFFSFWKRFQICPGSEKLPEISGFWQMFWISQFLERKKKPRRTFLKFFRAIQLLNIQ